MKIYKGFPFQTDFDFYKYENESNFYFLFNS